MSLSKVLSWAGTKTVDGCTASAIKVNIPLAINTFKDLELTISGQTRLVISNTENTLFLQLPLSSAPAAGVSVVLADPSEYLNVLKLLEVSNEAGGVTSFAGRTGAITAVAADISDASANGQSLITAANYAAMRTALSLVPGTNVQAYNAVLAALAALTNAANKGIKLDGSGNASTFDLTAAGLALLDDADASAQLTTLGALAKAGGTMTGPVRQTPSTQTYSSSMTFDVSTNNQFEVSTIVTADFAITLTNGQDGDCGTISFKQAAAGGKKITGITASGRTIKMDAGLTTINSTTMLVANSDCVLTYIYQTTGTDVVVLVSMMATVAAAYT